MSSFNMETPTSYLSSLPDEVYLGEDTDHMIEGNLFLAEKNTPLSSPTRETPNDTELNPEDSVVPPYEDDIEQDFDSTDHVVSDSSAKNVLVVVKEQENFFLSQRNTSLSRRTRRRRNDSEFNGNDSVVPLNQDDTEQEFESTDHVVSELSTMSSLIAPKQKVNRKRERRTNAHQLTDKNTKEENEKQKKRNEEINGKAFKDHEKAYLDSGREEREYKKKFLRSLIELLNSLEEIIANLPSCSSRDLGASNCTRNIDDLLGSAEKPAKPIWSTEELGYCANELKLLRSECASWINGMNFQSPEVRMNYVETLICDTWQNLRNEKEEKQAKNLCNWFDIITKEVESLNNEPLFREIAKTNIELMRNRMNKYNSDKKKSNEKESLDAELKELDAEIKFRFSQGFSWIREIEKYCAIGAERRNRMESVRIEVNAMKNQMDEYNSKARDTFAEENADAEVPEKKSKTDRDVPM